MDLQRHRSACTPYGTAVRSGQYTVGRLHICYRTQDQREAIGIRSHLGTTLAGGSLFTGAEDRQVGSRSPYIPSQVAIDDASGCCIASICAPAASSFAALTGILPIVYLSELPLPFGIGCTAAYDLKWTLGVLFGGGHSHLISICMWGCLCPQLTGISC